MLVKHINEKQFDIFFGTGWNNWARFNLEKGKPTQLCGIPVPKNIIFFLEKRYKA